MTSEHLTHNRLGVIVGVQHELHGELHATLAWVACSACSPAIVVSGGISRRRQIRGLIPAITTSS